MRSKPIILWPAIILYNIAKIIISIPRYMLIGVFFSLYKIVTLVIDIAMFISFGWWKIIKYMGYSIVLPFVLIKNSDFFSSDKRLQNKEEKDKRNYEKQMAKIKKQEEIKIKKDKLRLEKIEAKRLKEEKEKELAEQKILMKADRLEKERLAHASKNDNILVSGTIDAKNIVTKEMPKKVEKPKPKPKMFLKDKEENQKLLEKIERKKKLKEDAKKRKEELRNEKKKLRENNTYINENAKIEKKKLGDKINDVLTAMVAGPKRYFKHQKNKIFNNALVRNKKNQDLMHREALLIDFDSEDAKKSAKKVVYEYVGKSTEGKIVKDYFEAFSKVEVHSFLLSEGYEVYSIKTSPLIQLLHGTGGENKTKIKNKDLIFLLTQLSTYIKAGIPLVESLRILSRQFKRKSYQKIFRSLIYELTMGDNFSDAMAKQGSAFPRILVNMVKASEMTGELPETLDDMAEYFNEMEKTKKEMVTALTYPTIIFVLAIGAMVFIMLYIVPQFVAIYEDMDNAELPWITVAVLALSNFLKSYIFILIGCIILFIVVFIWSYKNVKIIRTMVQWFLMKLPIIGNVIIYNEVTMFTKTFASLLKHNVFITDSMDILNKVTNNEIWKMIILDTITNLAKGEKISLAFQDHWAVPLPAYEMIVTGERTGQLPEMMQKVSNYYQELHKNQVGRIKAFVEPILILFLTGAVGLIVMSIVIPMFGMYSQLS